MIFLMEAKLPFILKLPLDVSWWGWSWAGGVISPPESESKWDGQGHSPDEELTSHCDGCGCVFGLF